MSSSQKSQLINNMSRFGLDSRIGKLLLSVKGTSVRMGERVSNKPGYSPVILDYRLYRNGDPIKDIDWKISARTEKLFVKIREGYRQTDFVIVLDGSESMKTVYNNSDPSKFTTALTLAYITGRVALKSRDRLYILWSGERIHVDSENRLMDTLLEIESQSLSDKKYNDLWKSEFESSANVFLFSDFFVEPNTISHFIKELAHTTKNLFFLSIQDPYEKDFDFRGRYHFLDPESDSSILAETHDITRFYHDLYHDHFAAISMNCKNYGVKFGNISTDEDPFQEFLKVVS